MLDGEPQAVVTTFQKAGNYIFVLGWVSLLGKLIIELLVYLHCYSIEFDLHYKEITGEDEPIANKLLWHPVTGAEAEGQIS